jgi:two-component system chemotaxis response regulator CheB
MASVLDTNRRNIVAIGTSAGGVEVLRLLFAGLPADASASFFVVQHLSPHFPSELDHMLQSATSMHVTFASDRQRIMPDTVYIAPPDRHLVVEGDHVRITRGPRECRARPAVDVLFRSAALAFGPRVIGVVLTGALDDGTAGLWQIKDRKGLAFVQDPEEAAFRSMPESAIEHVEVDCIGKVAALAAEISREIAQVVALACPGPPRLEEQVEHMIALEGNGLEAGVMDLGKVSKYTCPECHGVLVQIEEGPLVRFRCHTGHAYSFKTLLAEVDHAADRGLWDAIRAIEERILILQQLADQADRAGNPAQASRLRLQADRAERKCEPLRELVLDNDFFTPG